MVLTTQQHNVPVNRSDWQAGPEMPTTKTLIRKQMENQQYICILKTAYRPRQWPSLRRWGSISYPQIPYPLDTLPSGLPMPGKDMGKRYILSPRNDRGQENRDTLPSCAQTDTSENPTFPLQWVITNYYLKAHNVHFFSFI